MTVTEVRAKLVVAFWRAINTFWEVAIVIVSDPFDLFDIDARAAIIAALVAAGLAAGRGFVLDALRAVQTAVQNATQALLGLFRS